MDKEGSSRQRIADIEVRLAGVAVCRVGGFQRYRAFAARVISDSM